MNRKRELVVSPYLFNIERRETFRTHVKKLTASKSDIDVSQPDLSLRHKRIMKKQKAKSKKMNDEKKKPRAITEQDIRNHLPMNLKTRKNFINKTVSFSDSRMTVADRTNQPLFSSMTKLELDKFDEEEDIVPFCTKYPRSSRIIVGSPKETYGFAIPGMESVNTLLNTAILTESESDDTLDSVDIIVDS